MTNSPEVEQHPHPSDASKDIPTRVFEEFLDALRGAGEDAVVVDQLRQTLLVDRVFTDRALRAALVPEEPKA